MLSLDHRSGRRSGVDGPAGGWDIRAMDIDARLQRAYKLLEDEEEIDPDALTADQRTDLALAILDHLAELRNQVAIYEELLARLAGPSPEQIEAVYFRGLEEAGDE